MYIDIYIYTYIHIYTYIPGMRGKKEGTHATIISFHVSTCLYDFRCRVAAQEKLCEAELQSPNIVSQRHPRARGHLDK